jgi:hypothetical protein
MPPFAVTYEDAPLSTSASADGIVRYRRKGSGLARALPQPSPPPAGIPARPVSLAREALRYAVIGALVALLSVGGIGLGVATVGGCGDNWPKAIEIGVTIGPDASGTACASVGDGGISEVDCQDGGAGK